MTKYGDYLEFPPVWGETIYFTELLGKQMSSTLRVLQEQGKLKDGQKIKLGWYCEVEDGA